MSTILDSLNEAWALYRVDDPAYTRPYEVAKSSVDASRLPSADVQRLAGEAVLALKEILDRIEMPPDAEIPDSARVEAEGLESWTIPNTEIELVRMTEGDQAGQFLVSAATVARIGEFYERVRHLPYRPGKTGIHYDELRFGTGNRLLGAVVSRLPESLKREKAGHLVWQWIGLALLILLSSAVAVVALLQGTKRARPGLDSHGWNQLWPFIFPLSLIILSGLVRYLSNRHFRIWGSVGANLRYVCTAVALVGLTWLSVVLVTRGAEQLIRLAGVERPLTRQLIRLSSRVGALVVILLWTFFGGQRLGIPITALLTGLGVGGLAVALAAQGTIENLIGGISLYADQPVRIGEVFKLGDRTGTLEEVGLRSAKVRTREETVVTVPNAEFAKLPLENLSRRTGYFLRSTLGIGYEATGDQVRYVLSRLTALLTAHPQIREDTEMVRLVDISPSHLEIEIRARADTTDFQHFTAIRQEMLLKAIAIVEEAGLALAVPPRLLHSAEDPRVESEKSGEGLRRVMKWRQKHDPAP